MLFGKSRTALTADTEEEIGMKRKIGTVCPYCGKDFVARIEVSFNVKELKIEGEE